MVGQRFCEKLVEHDVPRQYAIVTFCEEPRAAYDRVGLTSFFAHRSAEKLMLAKREWYDEHGITLHIGDRASQIERQTRRVHSDKGVEVAYDTVVLATGSYPFVPPVPGIDKLGVFVYRTIEDLERCASAEGDPPRHQRWFLGLEVGRPPGWAHPRRILPGLNEMTKLFRRCKSRIRRAEHLVKSAAVMAKSRLYSSPTEASEVDMIITSWHPHDDRYGPWARGWRTGRCQRRLWYPVRHMYAIGEVALRG
jgi:hypothetical protein